MQSDFALYTDQGIKNYLHYSDELKFDLFARPERATILKERILQRSENKLESVIAKSDFIDLLVPNFMPDKR